MCNISAAAVHDSSDSHFINRNGITGKYANAILELSSEPRQMVSFCEADQWPSSVGKTPLNCRGWVLQSVCSHFEP